MFILGFGRFDFGITVRREGAGGAGFMRRKLNKDCRDFCDNLLTCSAAQNPGLVMGFFSFHFALSIFQGPSVYIIVK